MLPNKVYDTLKWIVQYLLPGLAALYFGLSKIWPLPVPEQIVGTIVTVTVFLGTILGISNLRYKVKYKDVKPFVENVGPRSEYKSSFVLAMASNVYDKLKWGSMILLPALGALYFGLSKLWGLPYGQEIVATIATLETFMGVMLGLSTSEFESTGQLL